MSVRVILPLREVARRTGKAAGTLRNLAEARANGNRWGFSEARMSDCPPLWKRPNGRWAAYEHELDRWLREQSGGVTR